MSLLSALSLRSRRWIKAPQHLFDHLSFRTKFVVIGMVLAGPLSTLVGFVASRYDQRVDQAQARESALLRSSHLRDLALALAVHRGLSARILAGEEGASTELVQQQKQVDRLLHEAQESIPADQWRTADPPRGPSLVTEVHDLMRLSDPGQPERNFRRHNAVIDALLNLNARVGVGPDLGPDGHRESALLHLAFQQLPMLLEALGRQRGWGSAVLTQEAYADEDISRYMMYAGGAAQQLEVTQSAREALAETDQLLARPDQPAPLSAALNEADIFTQRSMTMVMGHEGGTAAAAEHFREGSFAINRLAEVTTTFSSLLMAHSQQDLAAAQRGRAGSLLGMGLVVLILLLIYRGFERSTVLRLRDLQRASRRLADGQFNDRVQVVGSDEIARLSAALDDMRQRLQNAVRERAEALAGHEAARAKTEFLARWSHDLRTPLAAVLGFADMLLTRQAPALSEAQREDVMHIREAGEHLLALVNDVLAVASLDARDSIRQRDDAVPIGPLVASAVHLVQAQARTAGVQLEWPREQGVLTPDWVRGDRTRLLQVLANLLSNAIKYNQAGGHVRLQWQAEGARVSIAVEDDGCGIAEEDLPRLFQPFERLATPDPGIEGLGLGLSNVKRLLEAMGGSVTVHSRLGEGSRFTVSLQRMAPPVTAASQLPSALPPAPALHARITYVEDDETNVLLLQAMLAAEPGLEVTVCHDGAQALASPTIADLWIIDGQLPDMDGVDLLKQLRRRPGPPPRAVMFSADALPCRRDQALDAGFIDLWVKPMGRDELLLRLRQLLSRPRPEGQGVSAAPLAQ
ncbi:ATP-binding protein [Ideonella sp. B508-1]|uniref:ATP-binding protein n=1 Tax=Ideonella sp. B508-1 TaxID=137716 RepID=UPI0003459E54|nr:ATP-binding protein [Ideonella sp. B508-1]